MVERKKGKKLIHLLAILTYFPHLKFAYLQLASFETTISQWHICTEVLIDFFIKSSQLHSKEIQENKEDFIEENIETQGYCILADHGKEIDDLKKEKKDIYSILLLILFQ